MCRRFAAALVLMILSAGGAAVGAPADRGPRDRFTDRYDIAADLSYLETITRDVRVDRPQDIAGAAETAQSFDPKTASVKLIEAWVAAPDGTRRSPGGDAFFIRPSAAARDAPGFVATETATIVMPQVEVGSTVHVVMEKRVTKAPAIGLNIEDVAPLFGTGRLHVIVTAPADLPLTVGHQGVFTISDRIDGGQRRIEAETEVRNASLNDQEPHMVASEQLRPLFLVTSFHSYEDIGAFYHQQSLGKAVVTPEIATLARSVVGAAQGRDAARLIYNWVAGHIRYVALWLGSDDNWVPHEAALVLKNGYGDCKDHVVLMQAMLAAVGITAEPALINWDNRFKPLPVASANSFNHTIIYLPDYDLYANPTSPYAPFGVLDDTLSGKLAVTAGAHPQVRTTPPAVPERAHFLYSAQMTLDADGTLTGQGVATMSPPLEAGRRAYFGEKSALQVVMNNQLAATPEGGFGRLKITDPRALDTPFRIETEWHSPHAVPPGSPYLMVPVGPSFMPFGALRGYLVDQGRRQFPVNLGIRDLEWRLNVRLPDGQAVQTLPPPIQIANEVGRYEAHYALDSGRLAVLRRLIFAHPVVDPTDYGDLEKLIYAALDDQRTILALSPAQH